MFDRGFRRLVLGRLSALCEGQLTVRDALGESIWGSGQPAATVTVREPAFYRRLARGGHLGAAESYLRGEWSCDDLTALVRILARNAPAFARLESGPSRRLREWTRWFRGEDRNSRGRSRKNIAAHYDLSNDFFRLFLDETMTYSCAIFPSPEASLRDASLEKFDRICRKLQLGPQDHVVEIGAGWGGFALHAAGRYGCRVTTTTISSQQAALARERIRAAGLDDRIRLLERDYRDLQGTFDKLVSIEMIEAVGHRYLDTYFRKCADLLKPGGMMALQAITIPDDRYESYRRSIDFIQRYIFPGGCLPSISAIGLSLRGTDLRLIHLEEFAPHYAETLRRWKSQFFARLADVRRLGMSDEFIRTWEFYLCYCEGAFEERAIGVAQMLFAKPLCRRAPILPEIA